VLYYLHYKLFSFAIELIFRGFFFLSSLSSGHKSFKDACLDFKAAGDGGSGNNKRNTCYIKSVQPKEVNIRLQLAQTAASLHKCFFFSFSDKQRNYNFFKVQGLVYLFTLLPLLLAVYLIRFLLVILLILIIKQGVRGEGWIYHDFLKLQHSFASWV